MSSFEPRDARSRYHDLDVDASTEIVNYPLIHRASCRYRSIVKASVFVHAIRGVVCDARSLADWEVQSRSEWDVDGRGRIVALALGFACMEVGFGLVVGRGVVVVVVVVGVADLEEGGRAVGMAAVAEFRER
jgi:hypothetical protein